MDINFTSLLDQCVDEYFRTNLPIKRKQAKEASIKAVEYLIDQWYSLYGSSIQATAPVMKHTLSTSDARSRPFGKRERRIYVTVYSNSKSYDVSSIDSIFDWNSRNNLNISPLTLNYFKWNQIMNEGEIGLPKQGEEDTRRTFEHLPVGTKIGSGHIAEDHTWINDRYKTATPLSTFLSYASAYDGEIQNIFSEILS